MSHDKNFEMDNVEPSPTTGRTKVDSLATWVCIFLFSWYGQASLKRDINASFLFEHRASEVNAGSINEKHSDAQSEPKVLYTLISCGFFSFIYR